MKYLLLIAFAIIFTGCTDAGFEKLTNYGNSAHIKCWSGGSVIYDGHSTGKVASEAQSDGYFFKDRETGKLKEVSGNCDITYE